MFRDCYFDYNGISSEKYNLKMYYIENDNMKFNSGGEFELKTDSIPYSYEKLYYGKDYSAAPLEFDIEIINPDENITRQKMAEIKNWLFDQDGWKIFKVLDDTQDVSLKCILTPIEDITNSRGYIGLRCHVNNVSPFWYSNSRKIILTKESGKSCFGTLINMSGIIIDSFNVNIPKNDYANFIIKPKMTVELDKTVSNQYHNNNTTFRLWCADNVSIHSELSFNYPYLLANQKDVLSINTKYITIKSNDFPLQDITPSISGNNYSFLKLKYGNNSFQLYGYENCTKITFEYTPVYRMGAF